MMSVIIEEILIFSVLFLTVAPGHDSLYCTKQRQCELGEGDCDSGDHCKAGLRCGNNNCKGSMYDPDDDCCERKGKKVLFKGITRWKI